jgi:hypothetical protein
MIYLTEAITLPNTPVKPIKHRANALELKNAFSTEFIAASILFALSRCRFV